MSENNIFLTEYKKMRFIRHHKQALFSRKTKSTQLDTMFYEPTYNIRRHKKEEPLFAI